MSYSDLVRIMEKSGANLAELAVGRMMDIVEEDTGVFPDWNDEAPEWIVEECFGGAK